MITHYLMQRATIQITKKNCVAIFTKKIMFQIVKESGMTKYKLGVRQKIGNMNAQNNQKFGMKEDGCEVAQMCRYKISKKQKNGKTIKYT